MHLGRVSGGMSNRKGDKWRQEVGVEACGLGRAEHGAEILALKSVFRPLMLRNRPYQNDTASNVNAGDIYISVH